MDSEDIIWHESDNEWELSEIYHQTFLQSHSNDRLIPSHAALWIDISQYRSEDYPVSAEDVTLSGSDSDGYKLNGASPTFVMLNKWT